MVALCCMYTGYIVTKSIKNNAIITFYPINFIELYILHLSLETVSLTKTLFQNKIQENLITNTMGTHYLPPHIWFNKALSPNIMQIF